MGRLLSLEERQAKRVVFPYSDGYEWVGSLIDEAEARETYHSSDYVYRLQLLQDKDAQYMRLCYYTRPSDGDDTSWSFARGAVTTDRAHWVNLFAAALERDWFRSVMEEARAKAHVR